MKCTACENIKNLKAQIKTIKYVVSGLDNIVIKGAKVYECNICGESYYQYGNVEEIDKLIQDALLKKNGPLTGKEIRFLRTYKGYDGKRFAALLQCSAEHLYRSEAKDTAVNTKFDRLVRLAIMSMSTDRNYEIHDMLEGKKELLEFARLELNLSGKHPSLQFA